MKHMNARHCKLFEEATNPVRFSLKINKVNKILQSAQCRPEAESEARAVTFVSELIRRSVRPVANIQQPIELQMPSAAVDPIPPADQTAVHIPPTTLQKCQPIYHGKKRYNFVQEIAVWLIAGDKVDVNRSLTAITSNDDVGDKDISQYYQLSSEFSSIRHCSLPCSAPAMTNSKSS